MMAYDPLANMSPELRPLLIAMEDVLNSPPDKWDIEPMEVRDFRSDAYRVWAPLLRAILDTTDPTKDQ